MTDQRPPYEDVEPAVSLGKGDAIDARPLPARPLPNTQPNAGAKKGERVELVPDLPQPWNEARIMRLAATLVGTLFIIGFVVAAARVVPLWLSWLPFLVGALPYLGFAGLAWRKHLDDESASRTRRENYAHSRFDAQFTPIADQPANTERWG